MRGHQMTGLQCRSLFDTQQLRLFDTLNMPRSPPENRHFVGQFTNKKIPCFAFFSTPPSMSTLSPYQSNNYTRVYTGKNGVAKGSLLLQLTGLKCDCLCTALQFNCT
jgi:hypothetical protein